MGRKRREVHLIFIFRRSSNLKFHKTTALNTSEKNLRRNCLVKIRLFLKLIWCMYDQSSLQPIDGKYRSLTAPLAKIYFTCEYFMNFS